MFVTIGIRLSSNEAYSPLQGLQYALPRFTNVGFTLPNPMPLISDNIPLSHFEFSFFIENKNHIKLQGFYFSQRDYRGKATMSTGA